MSYRNYVLVTTAAILGLSGCVAYLYYDRANMNSNWWGAAIQNQEESLRRINSLESLLEHDQLDELIAEVQKHRQSTLTSLDGMIRTRFPTESPNRVFALRVYCAEVTVDLPLCKASTASSR